MNRNKYWVLFIPMIIFFIGCEDVITLDLDSGESRLVVNGYISNQPGPYKIQLSRSSNYFEPNAFIPEKGAVVIISDNTGLRDTLKELNAGLYSTTHILGIVGRSYTLTITTVDKTNYTAVSILNAPVNIDSIKYESGTNDVFGHPHSASPKSYQISCYYTDPATIGNYYRFLFYKNDSLFDGERDFYIASDELVHRSSNFVRANGVFESNDSVKVDLLTMDKKGFDFYNDLRKLINAQSSLLPTDAPANPINNISNGALGYFGAYAITSKIVVIK